MFVRKDKYKGSSKAVYIPHKDILYALPCIHTYKVQHEKRPTGPEDENAHLPVDHNKHIIIFFALVHIWLSLNFQ